MTRDHIALIIYLLLFGLIGLLAVVGYFNNTALFNIGIAPKTLDIIIIVLSFAGIFKTLFHIHRS